MRRGLIACMWQLNSLSQSRRVEQPHWARTHRQTKLHLCLTVLTPHSLLQSLTALISWANELRLAIGST